ncbi:flagellar hook-associated protein FlgK [Sphingomonas sp. ID0503]|uniref:flagellar hook-associated protein FlgK n=1 Tax=Sphingomonas sp. ID0503 TaxID=3399691 RepID=UPI003AFB58E2
MSNLLGIGVSGVRAYQSALTVVGENIANAGTTGYVRRDIRLSESAAIGATGPLQLSLGNYSGVDATGVSRSWDQFKAAAVRTSTSDLTSTEASITYLTRIESALSGNSVTDKLTAFFNAATALAADPSSAPPRAAFLTQADAVAQAFRGTSAALDTIARDIVNDAKSTTDTLNGLANSLTQVNATMARTRADSAASAALLDQRDAILDKMSALAGISVSIEKNGVANVRLGTATGPLLIDNIAANRVNVSSNTSGTLAFSIVTDGNHLQNATISGGALAGLTDAALRISNTREGLDEIANGFAAAVNGIQADGIDSNGNAGKPLFTTSYSTVSPMPGTSGGASVEVAIAANATPSADGYTALWDSTASSWTISRLDGTGTPVTGTGTLTIDGISVTLGGTPQAGDGYTIATGQGARGLTGAALDPREVAAASKWSVNAPITNSGTGAITVAIDTTAAGLPTLNSYKVSFDNGQLTVTDPLTDDVLLTTAFVAGAVVEGDGFTFKMTGAPRNGDSYTIGKTGANSLSNGNLAAYATLRNSGTYENRIDALANTNAAALASRKALAEAQGAIRDNAVAAQDSVSGVNLDSEAVDLLRFQQAYQASSRVIQVARETFQSILDLS